MSLSGRIQIGYKIGFIIGLSELHALPLAIAAERSVHYFGDYFSSFLFFLGVLTFKEANENSIRFSELEILTE